VCELEPELPFKTDTICWIASLTKPITATAAMKLVESGQLDLDKPVAEYLPELSHLKMKDGTGQVVTVRHLMSHSSGIPASVPLRPSYFFTQQWFDRELPEVVTAIAARPLDFEPGTEVHYSNAAPYVLGSIIELLSGKKLDVFMRQQIFDPLRMNDTGFAVPKENENRTAVVYRRQEQELSVYCRYDPDWSIRMTMPDGGLFSTAADIARFANSFLDIESGVLGQESVKQMLAKQNEQYGLGWILDKPNQFSHWGSSGTLVWADQRTGVVGVFFSQIQDFDLLAKLRERFRSSVDAAIANAALEIN
jgi:CubicO group peptidase (beta-lactamase class C family)